MQEWKFFNELNFRHRLQELENESEQLDKSFQSYLKKQNEQKRVLADDIDKVWQQYERAKDNMIKTFVVPDRRNVATNIHFHENVIPVPFTTDELIAPSMESGTSQFRNPYKILHDNLTMTGSLDASTSKKENAVQTIGSLPTLTLQQNERITLADKVSQIPIPMKIKSIMKRPVESESKAHLRISASVSNDHASSEPSDASSYLNLKNVSASEVVHLSDSRPSESIKSKHSGTSPNSPQSDRSERILNNGNTIIRKSNDERMDVVSNGMTVQTGTVAKQRNVDTKDISALFKKVEIENRSTHSTSSESSDKRNISTGHKSSSSDEFWK